MKLYNRKKKEWVELKEFWKQWKEGMERVTPLQQTYTALFGQVISGIGVIWGIIFSIRLSYWWMMIILIGGLIVLSTQLLGTWQKKQILKRMEDTFKLAEVENGLG
jgi:hypothetical protein